MRECSICERFPCYCPKPEGGMKKYIFLDIDGVLNDHKPMANGYCALIPSAVAELNKVIDAHDPEIIVHSAWRYLMLNGSMNLDGFASLLATHGVKVYRGINSHRITGHTRYDAGDGSRDDRTAQILEEVDRLGLKSEQWVAIDDLDLSLPYDRFHRTMGTVGFTNSARVIEMLGGSP